MTQPKRPWGRELEKLLREHITRTPGLHLSKRDPGVIGGVGRGGMVAGRTTGKGALDFEGYLTASTGPPLPAMVEVKALQGRTLPFERLAQHQQGLLKRHCANGCAVGVLVGVHDQEAWLDAVFIPAIAIPWGNLRQGRASFRLEEVWHVPLALGGKMPFQAGAVDLGQALWRSVAPEGVLAC